MMQLIFFLDAAQDRNRILHRWLIDKYRLEAPGQSRVLFHMFAILIQGRGPHAMQFTPRQGRFQKIGGIHGTFGLASTHKRVHFINEQDDAAFCRRDFRQHGFQAFLKLAAEFCASDQGSHVE